MNIRSFLLTLVADAIMSAAACGGAAAQNAIPTDRVYQGPVHFPDFAGRDRKFASFRTRIREGMSTGPDFAGHYALIQIGCGTECSFVVVGDVATGQVYDFPYGGETYRQMQVFQSAKAREVKVAWLTSDRCFRDNLTWTGSSFRSLGKMDIGPSEVCERL